MAQMDQQKTSGLRGPLSSGRELSFLLRLCVLRRPETADGTGAGKAQHHSRGSVQGLDASSASEEAVGGETATLPVKLNSLKFISAERAEMKNRASRAALPSLLQRWRSGGAPQRAVP